MAKLEVARIVNLTSMYFFMLLMIVGYTVPEYLAACTFILFLGHLITFVMLRKRNE